MQLTVLTAADLRTLVDMPAAIEAVREAFVALSSGGARIPLRTAVDSATGVTALTMPGALDHPAALGAKLVTVAAGNAARGLPAVNAVILLVDPETGRPTALLEGGWLTALRTGAASGVATHALAADDSRVLAVIGAGVQARTQIEAVRAVRRVEQVRIHSRTRASAERLAQELVGVQAVVAGSAREAVEGAQVIVTATDSAVPVLPADAVDAGSHVNAVGAYRPDMAEIPPELVERCRVVVDQRGAALEEAGDLIGPVGAGRLDAASLVELGDILTGVAVGRRDPDEVTLFKSVGSAAQDLAVAALALERARVAGVGTTVPL